MGITRFIKRLALLGAGLFCLTSLFVLAGYILWPDRAMKDLPSADAIVCLAAGLKEDGTIGTYTRQRAQSCIDLYLAGKAPLVAFTGGNSTHDAPPTGVQMGALARARGVPGDVIVTEERSESTLQNALFTLPLLPTQTETILLVTDRFHLARSTLSFKWAGVSKIFPIATLPESGPESGRTPRAQASVKTMLREIAAMGFNALRAPVYWLAGRIGIDDDSRAHVLH